MRDVSYCMQGQKTLSRVVPLHAIPKKGQTIACSAIVGVLETAFHHNLSHRRAATSTVGDINLATSASSIQASTCGPTKAGHSCLKHSLNGEDYSTFRLLATKNHSWSCNRSMVFVFAARSEGWCDAHPGGGGDPDQPLPASNGTACATHHTHFPSCSDGKQGQGCCHTSAYMEIVDKIVVPDVPPGKYVIRWCVVL